MLQISPCFVSLGSWHNFPLFRYGRINGFNNFAAFKGLRLRIGGSLQDQVVYDVGNLNIPCHPFRKQEDGLFGFSHGCLHMDRWDELNGFFKKTG